MTLEELQSRRVGVLGFGQEGQAVATYLLRHGIKPVLFDKHGLEKFGPAEQALIAENNLETEFGPEYLEQLPSVEVIFRSPGIWRLLPQLKVFETRGGVITSQTLFFFEHCPVRVIGVTGTKGKGTTASLITHFLRAADKSAYLTGNVGQVQPLDFLAGLQPQDLVVYELSSFQLQDLTVSPQMAVVLMVTNDHLDIHATVEEYREAKTAITKYQNSNDLAIINYDFPASRQIGQSGAAKKLFYSQHELVQNGAYIEQGQLLVVCPGQETLRFDLAELPLRGQHNWDNAAAAILAALNCGVTAESVRQALPHFKPLPHRLEPLPDQANIHFFDDSISTVPDTAAAAIRSFTEPVIILVGGYDKGLDPEPLLQALTQAPNIKAVVAIGTTGPSLVDKLRQRGFSKTILQGFGELKTAMQAIKRIATAGDVVLLSPGYASFGWYDNYKRRGEDFAQVVALWESL